MKKPLELHFILEKEKEQLLKDASLARYSANKPHDLVLETLSDRSFIKKGVSQWKFSLSDPSLLSLKKSEGSTSERVIVKAQWYSSKEADRMGIARNVSKNSNIFEGKGVLLVSEGFKIPTVEATHENIEFYGLKLVEDGSSFPEIFFEENTILMEYDYKPNYKKDFLTEESGGGGYYVEEHNFPHIHIPLSRSSDGYIIIGKKLSAFLYSFTAFKIPYGFALYTPAGTIHGDGALVGKYGITVADSKTSADTVLFFGQNTLVKVDDIL